MKAGQISVYTGRVMVIGCAEAGKTTLVKKLKGEKDLSTESTSGIEIYSHVFKLHANESTIIGKLDFKSSGVLGICRLLTISIFNISGSPKLLSQFVGYTFLLWDLQESRKS